MAVNPDSAVNSPQRTNPVLTRRRMMALALGGTAAVAASAPTWAVPAWAGQRALQPPARSARDRLVTQRVSAQRAIEHLRVLTMDIGPRIGGTPSERAAADYMAGLLDRYGYATTLQPFAVGDKFLAELDSPGGLPDTLGWQVGASPHAALDVTVSGEVLDVGAGSPADYPADAAGKIVLVDYVSAQREALVAAAIANDAAGVVFLAADRTEPRRAPAFSPTLPGSASQPVSIPVVGAAQAQKNHLRALLASGPLTLAITTVAYRGLTSHNVLAERVGRQHDGGPVVVVCAHYDSVIGAPGADDDGSGTVLCLELARVLRKLPIDATIRFALWGSEEQGLIGSRYHVAQLPQAERDRIVAVFNNDMVGTSWEQATRYWVLSYTGEANRATDEVIAAATRLGYDPLVSPVTRRGASDHQSFQEVGIAGGNFSWRGEATPALLEPPYHTPEDTIANNISLARLQISMEIVGAATYATARPR